MIPLEVGTVIDEFNVGPLTVERRSTPTKNFAGGRDPATPEQFTLDPVAAHATSGRSILQSPEADRNVAVTEFYTKVRLHVADAGRVADVVNYRGRRWRIVPGVQDYELQGDVYISFGLLENVQALP